jgi:hypothetical protein
LLADLLLRLPLLFRLPPPESRTGTFAPSLSSAHVSTRKEAKMRLFVSVRSIEEAMVCTAVSQHVDMVDVENPDEGSPGAHFPWVIKAVKEMTPRGGRLSAAVGDASSRPGAAALAALGAAVSGADLVKVGLFGVTTPDQAVELVRGVVRAVKDHDPATMVVAVGYADARRVGSVNPLAVPRIAHDSGAEGAMLDTAVKDGSSLFDHLPPALCGDFVSAAHEFDLFATLAGSLTAHHVGELTATGTDAIGVRGAVCSDGDRSRGTIRADLVASLHQNIADAESGRAARADHPLLRGVAAVS